MAEIRDREGLEAWLKTQPPEVSMAIAARSALRVLPLLVGIPKRWMEQGEEQTRAALLPQLFYGAAMPWFIAFVPDHDISNASTSATAHSVFAAARFANRRVLNTSSVRAVYAATGSCAPNHRGDAAAAAASSVDALTNTNRSINDYSKSVEYSWRVVSTDCSIIESGGLAVLATAHLWPNGERPKRTTHAWWRFRQKMRAEKIDFDVWTTWYDARLRGDPPDMDEQRIRASMEAKWFDEGPAAYNAELKRRLREAGKWVEAGTNAHSTETPPEPSSVQGVQLRPTPSGLDVADGHVPDNERDDPQIAALHQSILRRVEKLDALIARLDNSHRVLSDEYRDFAVFISNDLPDVNVATIWSVGSALTEIIDQYDARRRSVLVAGRPADIAELPDEQIFGQLVQLSRDYAAFILAFEEGRVLLQRARDMRMEQTASQAASKAVLHPMLGVAGLLAERAKRLVSAVYRALDAVDDHSAKLASTSIGLATNSIIAIGKVAQKNWKPLVATSVVIGAPLDIAHKLAGDPNWEMTRAAMFFLTQNADALHAFANHDPVMRRWLEWTIEEVNAAIVKDNQSEWENGLAFQRRIRDEW